MKLDEYKKVVEKIRILNKRSCTEELINYFPNVPVQSLESIYYQEYQRKTKRNYYRLTSPQKAAYYFQRYEEEVRRNTKCGFLLKFADKVDISPSFMAKLVLEEYYKKLATVDTKEEKKPTDVGKSKQEIADLIKDTSLIKDGKLAVEIRMCVLADECYGPISDVIRRSIGEAYETKLKDELKKLGLPYVDEVQLRRKGYDKTPDVKLEVPIAVGGRVVNWIESKASFGDEDRHREYLRDQYWSYCNRFGPGLVIYWLGYIEELNVNTEQGIMISDNIPSQITFINPSILIQKNDTDPSAAEVTSL